MAEPHNDAMHVGLVRRLAVPFEGPPGEVDTQPLGEEGAPQGAHGLPLDDAVGGHQRGLDLRPLHQVQGLLVPAAYVVQIILLIEKICQEIPLSPPYPPLSLKGREGGVRFLPLPP